MKGKGRWTLLAVATVAGWMLGPVSPSNAAEVGGLRWGYWWSAQQDAAALPAPPQVPTDGLYVASNASGVQAISAITFTPPFNTADPKLVLHVASLHDVGSFALAAYPATGKWTPANDGPWSQRPAYGPLTRRIVGTLSADQSTITFNLAPYVVAGTVDVVIAPVPTSTAPEQYPTLDVAFNPPKASDITTTLAAPTPPPPVAGAGGSAAFPADQGPAAAPLSNTGALPGLGSPVGPTGLAPTSSAPVVAPPSATLPTGAPAASGTPIGSGGRSTRDTLILAFLLANALNFLVLRGRNAARSPDISIYDLPPTPQALS